MKKIVALLLAVSMLFAFVACDTGNGSSSPVGTGTESESGTGTGSTGSEDGNTGSGSTGSEGGNTGSGSTGGNGSSSTGGTGSGSTEEQTSYVGTWTGSMGGATLSITLNADGIVSANNSMEGDTTGFWTVTNSGFIMWLDVGDECPEEEFPENLQGDELKVNYMGQNISLTKK